MRKFAYLCALMLLNMNIIAQIDLNDRNWDTLFIEDFSGNRYWDSTYWEDARDINGYQPIWKCFSYESWPSGVTLYNPMDSIYKGFHAYQPSHTVFGSDHTMKLTCEFQSYDNLRCDTGYYSAPWIKYCHGCELPGESYHPQVHYYSGMIETIDPVGFGYYEIECKMPIHDHGEFSAFWFWSVLGGTYNEIDVFEHSKDLSGNDIARGTLSGIWYNPQGTNYSTQNGLPVAQRYANHRYVLPTSSQTLDEYHTFGCFWMSDQVVWYVDGTIVNECKNRSQIPQFPMWLKIIHYADKYARSNNRNDSWWTGSDEMTINYVKAYRLKTDCTMDAVVRTVLDFNNFEYRTKRSIVMGGVNNTLTIPNNSSFTMRAVESITIDGGFVLPQGAEMTFLIHDCPECSMEGVVLPNYDCGMETYKK